MNVTCVSPRRRFGAVLVTSFLVALLPACATNPDAPAYPEFSLPDAPPQAVIQPGDLLEVKFVYWDHLNEAQTVRPDGMISLPLITQVKAAGLTPGELHDQLTQLYKDELKDPEITVLLRTEESRRVYVGGEILEPGLVELRGRLTAMEAIMAAGGLNKASARLENVLVIRRIEERLYARTLDLRDHFKKADLAPFFLEPNDIIFVPRTHIDRANHWVDQYVNRMIPDMIYFSLDDIEDLFGGDDDEGGVDTRYVPTVTRL
jgi:protein involved in polysaccharide export with SLBB domain